MSDRLERRLTDLARASILGAVVRAYAPEHVAETAHLLRRHRDATDPLTRERLWRTGLGHAGRAVARRELHA